MAGTTPSDANRLPFLGGGPVAQGVVGVAEELARMGRPGCAQTAVRGQVGPARHGRRHTRVRQRGCDSTKPFALDPAGNGRTRDRLKVPMRCNNLAVLIQPVGLRSVYIASTTMDDQEDD